jgi:hypothetical protein
MPLGLIVNNFRIGIGYIMQARVINLISAIGAPR